ncbi:MAG: hypothetical protein ACRDGW_00120 [Actinomycetota bacterium]
MPAIIDSAPECVTNEVGTEDARVEDSADFILQANYEDCAGFMTFGPGSTYGPEGEAADTAYYILTWLGIGFMVFVLIAWVIWEHRHLLAYAAGHVTGGRGGNRT